MDNDDYLLNEDAKEFYAAIQSLETDKDCKEFLRDLLTEAELKECIQRWKVVRMLDQKVPYEEITHTTGMSSKTIARISKWLQKGMGGYRLILDRIKKN